MWECLVKLPSSSLLEVTLPAEASLGIDLLSEVCKRLGTIEEDFFGLQVNSKHGNSGEKNWINLRNRLKPQLHSAHRVDLRVKFYVEPHNIIQESTRLLVFNNLRHDLHENLLHCSYEESLAMLVGNIAQANVGNVCKYSRSQLEKVYTEIIPLIDHDDTLLQNIYDEHCSLSGMKQGSAIYNAIKVASAFEHYGEEYHDVITDSGHYTFGVGPAGISLYEKALLCQTRIPYQAVLKATHKAKEFYLQTATDSCTILRKRTFRLASSESSRALYRSVTEMYLFYICDTVRNDVSSQFCRDFKGTLASIFNENTELGKKFVFDIQRTLKEANDHTRRQVLRLKSSNTVLPMDTSECYSWLPGELTSGLRTGEVCEESVDLKLTAEGKKPRQRRELGSPKGESLSHRRHSWSASCEASGMGAAPHLGDPDLDDRDRDTFLCQVCMARDLNTVFIPCGHAACCEQCAAKMKLCPICRAPVGQRQLLFLPNRMRHASR